jgi:hypothetical protein
MFGSNALEIAIGLVFVYLLLSLLCTVINEGIANALEQRGKNLLEGVKNLLNDPEFNSLAQHVYNHGLIGGITKGVTDFAKTNRLPSYIGATNFALALLDILGSNGAGQVVVEQKQKELEEVQRKSAADTGNEALKKAVSEAEAALKRATTSAADVQQKFADAREAAKKVQTLKDFGKIKEASETLESALAAGRAMASEFPDPLGSLQKGIEALSPGHTKQSLLTLLDKTKRDQSQKNFKQASTQWKSCEGTWKAGLMTPWIVSRGGTSAGRGKSPLARPSSWSSWQTQIRSCCRTGSLGIVDYAQPSSPPQRAPPKKWPEILIRSKRHGKSC